MNSSDSATASAPVEPGHFDDMASLDDALNDFAPEGPSGQAQPGGAQTRPVSGQSRPMSGGAANLRSVLNAADQFVRDFRSRKPQAAPAPRPRSAFATRALEVAKRSAQMVLLVGAVGGALVGLTFVGLRVAEITKSPESILGGAPDEGGVAVADEASPARSGSPQRARPSSRVSATTGARQSRQAGAPIPSGPQSLGPADYPRTASPAPSRGLAAQPSGASAASPQRLGGESIAAGPMTQLPSADEPEVGRSAVYSSEDQEVLPPRMLTSELPRPLISGAPTRTESIEVIVSERGTVERARYISTPRRMPDMMILSHAKVWEFSPALKDGRPVRYRLILSWETN